MEYLLLLAGFALLLVGGEALVRGAAGVALKLRITPMIVGLTVVSMGTSAPELFISLKAAMAGSAGASIGNVIGSNVANLALVLGLTAFILPLPVDKIILRKDWAFLAFISVGLYILAYNGMLERWEGILMIAILVVYISLLIRESQRDKLAREAEAETAEFGKESSKPYWLLGVFVGAGIVALYFGTELFISGAKSIAKSFGMSDATMGVTVLAFGTSVPELATSVIAAFRKQVDIGVGNLIGSNIFNILAVLGITSAIQPLQVEDRFLQGDLWWMLGVTFFILPIVGMFGRINRVSGALLFAGYVVYVYRMLL